jgi:hypothetical protein
VKEVTRQGSLNNDILEKILGLIKVDDKTHSSREIILRIKWKRDPATGLKPLPSDISNTELKLKCPALLFGFMRVT